MARNTARKCLLFCLGLTAVMAAPVTLADRITDVIDRALQNYKAGKLTDAAADLAEATDLIHDKKSNKINHVFPPPLDGWKADKAESQSAGATMMEGGLTAERTYRRDDSNVTIEIIADSEALKDMLALFSDPMFMSADGGQLEPLGDQKAIVKYNSIEHNGDVKLVVAERFLVTVAGLNVSREELLAYAASIDFDKLKALP